jgi:hypothetical protein
MLSIMIIISDGSKTAGYSMIYEPVKNTSKQETIHIIKSSLLEDYGIDIANLAYPVPFVSDGADNYVAKAISMTEVICQSHSLNNVSKVFTKEPHLKQELRAGLTLLSKCSACSQMTSKRLTRSFIKPNMGYRRTS